MSQVFSIFIGFFIYFFVFFFFFFFFFQAEDGIRDRTVTGVQTCALPISVRDLNLRRGPFSITFDRGRMIFLRPVENVVTGLYFWGNGTMVGIPPNKIERQQLNLFTGAPVLNERFQEAFIRFSDDAYRELIEQSEAYDNNVLELNVSSELFQGVLKASSLINYRIVADLMHGRRAPFFSAKMLGRKLGIFDFSYDERRAEDVNVGQFHKTAGRTFYDNWCSFSSR